MHKYSVFTNSCLKVPVDPLSKMPKTAYERSDKALHGELSIDSSTTVSTYGENLDTKKLKDFFRSIPEYNDINHLPANEFYSTLKSLREKKKIMLDLAIDNIDKKKMYDMHYRDDCNAVHLRKDVKTEPRLLQLKKNATEKSYNSLSKNTGNKSSRRCLASKDIEEKISYTVEVKNEEKVDNSTKQVNLDLKATTARPKRNHSACSISWHDNKIVQENEIDDKFEKYFDPSCKSKTFIDDSEFQTQSMPSSPLRMKRFGTVRGNITIPKPFKMTERDEEERIVNELRSLQKSFSEDMLNQKFKRKQFKARLVPIESRIPLYDKILEDQAMRRAITKINSEAELRAQMKLFSFSKKEEDCNSVCERAVQIPAKYKKKKRFRARPVPKNLFSNYFYDKIKEDNYFRSMNRRIRAEELLLNASLPGTMALRERSRLSTPAAHSDLPIDPSSAGPSISSGDHCRAPSPIKGNRKSIKNCSDRFISTSPQPFRFYTANRADKKIKDIQKKLRQDNKSDSTASNRGISEPATVYSALDLKSVPVGKSNLAALLRTETVRRKLEIEAAKRLAEQRRKNESKYRDRLLRTKPAWHLVKNNHDEDIAIRLQTRRDEERLRREEFLHEMELMYGRVRQQPMLFERYYAPRPPNTPIDFAQLLPLRKSPKKKNSRNKYYIQSPSRFSDIEDDIIKHLDKSEKKEELSADSDFIESIEKNSNIPKFPYR